ncbi:MAG: ATP-binding cassette domain-containing protein [Ruminococcus sp.]|nr:ATP-binding cassette domain-containing protein [Ruminococcus sp.]
MLSLKNITKDYIVGDSKVQALKGVSIEFREHEFVSILGQSGCGKTTLLNIIGGLDRYTDGDLRIGGKSTKDFKDSDWDSYRNHSIGFVFQSYNLIPHQTVLSNVELALTLSGVSNSERRQRAIDALKQVGLGDQLNKKPNQMSGGQMQRVAIARALVNNPDILLADEPTGALDTETSVQIMEILKSISKDKLIIMVTHNPDLAMEYSSRIIKLLDGKVVDDSDPYDKNVVEPIKKPEKEMTKAERKAQKKERKKLKTSMSFWTALSLSKNNLMTKKARTLLTSFAGSIGIIGIALILSISNGVQVYIDQVQSDTLSSYPLQIAETNTSFGDIMNTMAEETGNSTEHDLDKIYSQNQMGTMINSLLEETRPNNLTKLKEYLDSNDEIGELVTDIQYGYSTDLNVFKADTSDGAVQVNPSTVLTDMGYFTEDQMSAVSTLSGGMGSDAWAEIINNQELVEKQYDIVAGRFPENYNEVVLVVNKYNEINDYFLYSLGILDSTELNGIMRKAAVGEEIDVNTEQQSYTYDEIFDLKFKLVPTTDFYKKENGVWVDMREDEEYMKSAVENGAEISIVGIIRPNEDASSASINGAIGYTHELMTYLLDEVENSEIVKEQLANPEIDVFTGLKFESGEEDVLTDEKTDESSVSGGENDSAAESDSLAGGETADSAAANEMTDEQKAALAAMSADSSADIDMENLTDEQLAQLAAMQGEDGELPEGADMSEITEMSGMTMEDFSAMQDGSTDMTGMSEAQKKYLASLTDEQMELMQEIMQEQQQALEDANSGKTSQSTYEDNLTAMGYAMESEPNSINIYPIDFASKERIIDIIDEYNNSVDEVDQIEYTDYVGLMMSSITAIIDAISYVLIAFVAISLVVSSIMIGIITYISVLERTKEIGILRSIGASKKDISRVFNAETVIVGFVAGALGIGLSYLLTIPINAIIAHLTDVPMRASIPAAAAVILVLISVCLTLIAGLFPSKIAAKKDPVIALRTE